jgi:menaquinol-cytochrome c reductase iron-sulfur subunit
VEKETNPIDNELSRQSFLKIAVASLVSISGLVVGLPLIGSLIGPALRFSKGHFSKVGNVDSLTQDQPADLTFADMTEDAFIRTTQLRSVWAVKKSQNDVTVYSPICPHLGCHYNWEAQNDQFVCPCHGSVFSIDGKVLSGPAPRPLDTLPTKIENGELYVEWERFKVGTPQKEVI